MILTDNWPTRSNNWAALSPIGMSAFAPPVSERLRLGVNANSDPIGFQVIGENAYHV